MSYTLSIKKTTYRTISPEAEEFNKLLAKIERLKEKIILKNNELESCLDYLTKKGFSILKHNLDLRFKFSQLLFKLIDSKIVSSPKDKDFIVELLFDQIHQLKEMSELYLVPDFEQFEKEVTTHPELALNDEMVEGTALFLKKQFEELGLDTDLDFANWIRNGGSMEDLQEKLREKMGEKGADAFFENQTRNSTKRKPGKTSKRGIEIKLVEKNLNDLYRQLARVFHPDLESDEEKRGAKEELMKELNHAYKSKNIYAMLQMEVQWLAASQDRLGNLPAEKLKVFVLSLKEQLKILNAELKSVPNQPRFEILHKVTFPFYCESIPDFYGSLNGMTKDSDNLEVTIEQLGNVTDKKSVRTFLSKIKINSYGY